MSNIISDQELMNQYVLLSKTEYQASIRALQSLDIINEILDHAGKYQIPNLIRIVLGKQVDDDD